MPQEELAAESAIGLPQAHCAAAGLAFTAVILSWIFYATTVPMLQMFWRSIPLPTAPLMALQPFRIANEYGLFAVMTPNRYEIEFQGSDDGKTWIAYPFRYKPQAINKAPGIYAPYQPQVRLESVVRIAGLVDAISHRAANGRVAADQRSRRAVTVRRKSISESSSAHGACRAVAILVHHHRRKTARLETGGVDFCWAPMLPR